MKILEQALNKIKSLNKKQRDFLALLVQGLIGIVGKRNFRNLARYMSLEEHAFSRQMAKAIDFVEINKHLIEAFIKPADILIAAQDTTFIKKSGKKTPGLDYYWSGCAGRVEKGLELDLISIIKIGDKREGLAVSALQTMSNMTEGANRIDAAVEHVQKIATVLKELRINHIAVDAFYTKEKYVTGVVQAGLHTVGKLRKDARLRRPYHGQQKGRGRKKLYETGPVTEKEFTKKATIQIEGEDVDLYNGQFYSLSLKRLINVLLIKKNNAADILLFSTDLTLTGLQIYQFYTARFQIEFIFRDAKNFTGLEDCQSRDPRRLHNHFNASLTALNVAKIKDSQTQAAQATRNPFSMNNYFRKYHVEIVINRFISMFGFDQTSIKLHPKYQEFLSFGSIRH